MYYHFSEESNINKFTPRKTNSFPNLEPVVWALDQKHALHYYFPRDCPRVIYWKAEQTSEADIAKYFDNTSVDKIIVIESHWLERIRSTELYRYTFPEEAFQRFEEAKSAGYYISFKEVIPTQVELVSDLLSKILSEKIELRITPNLNPIRNSIISSTLDFSIIRFKHASTE